MHERSGSSNSPRRALRASLAAVGGQAATHGLRLVANLVLTRLLFPEAFGLMAVLLAACQGLQMLSDVGISQSVVQNRRGAEPEFLRTAWTLQILRGVLLFLAGCAAAGPLALIYDEPRIAAMLPVLATTAIFAGLESTNAPLAHRDLKLGRMLGIDLTAQLCAFAVTIAAAWTLRSAWALVVGAIASSLVRAVLTHAVLPGPRCRLGIDRGDARSILVFGKWIFVSTVVTFLALRLDVALLAKLTTLEVLGVYSIATMVASVPALLASQIANSVLLPLLAASFREGDSAFAASFARSRDVFLPLCALVMLGAALVAPAFILLCYDARYEDAAWMAQLALVVAWFAALQESSGRACLARGTTGVLAVANAVRLAAATVLVLVGFRLHGMIGLQIGAAFGVLAGHAVVVLGLARSGLPTAMQDLRWTMLCIGLGVPAAALPHVIAERFGVDYVTVTLIVACVVLAPCAVLAARALRGRFTAA